MILMLDSSVGRFYDQRARTVELCVAWRKTWRHDARFLSRAAVSPCVG